MIYGTKMNITQEHLLRLLGILNVVSDKVSHVDNNCITF